MTPEKAIACIDEVLISTVNYDESLEYELSSYDIDWLEKAREALVQKTEYDKISRSVKEFWGELEKLSIAKGKEKPTLEELLEYIEQAKSEAVNSFVARLKEHEKFHYDYDANLSFYYIETDTVDKVAKEKVDESDKV